MQVTPRISPAGVLASAFALVAIASPISAHAHSRRTMQLHGNPIDGHATHGSPTLFTVPEAHRPTGVAFGNAASRHTAADRGPLLNFTINRIGPVDRASDLIAADGMAFDRSGNFYVAHFSARTIVKFDAAGPIDVFDAAEFAPLPAFLGIEVGDPTAFQGPINPLDAASKPRVGPIPEPAGVGMLTAVALLGVGVSRRLRRQASGSLLPVAAGR